MSRKMPHVCTRLADWHVTLQNARYNGPTAAEIEAETAGL